jgi:hypothetical protein
MRGARQGIRFELTLEQQQMTAHGHEHAQQECGEQAYDGDWVFGGQFSINTFHLFSDFGIKRQSVCHWYMTDYQCIVKW